MVDNEILLKLIKLLSSNLLWLYFVLVILGFYLILSLITWSFKRPLKFLGIPSIITGLIMIIAYFIIKILPLPLSDGMITILTSGIKPVFNIGLVCFLMGIIMLILLQVINLLLNKKNA